MKMTRGKKTVSDQDLRQILKRANDPILTAREVADRADITRQAAYHRLTHLHKRGEISRKKSGSRTVVWWIED